MMGETIYIPPPEAFALLPADYFDLLVEDRARALQTAGRIMCDDVFAEFFSKTRTDP